MDIKYDDKKQTIQGYRITNRQDYFYMKTAVSINHLAGYNPTYKDIKHIYETAQKEYPKLKKEIKKEFRRKIKWQ